MAVAPDVISVLPDLNTRRRLRVLLTVDRGHLDAGGGVGNWCELLVRGLPEMDFSVLELANGSPSGRALAGTPNVVSVVAIIGDGRGGPRVVGSGGRRRLRRRRPRQSDVERRFLPLLGALLDMTASEPVDTQGFGALLADMQDHFLEWDYRATWAAPPVWESFRARAWDLDGTDGPSLAEAAEAFRWTAGALSVLALELPSFDLVHSTSAGLASIPGIVAGHRQGTPLLLTDHHVYFREAYLSCALRDSAFCLKRHVMDVVGAVVRTSYASADLIAPVCRRNADWELAQGAPHDRIRVIYSGVDENTFRPANLARTGPPTVVSVGRVAPAKDLETMLRVADRVRRDVPDVQFLHYGPVVDGDYWRRLVSLWHDRRLEGTVRFIGRVDRMPEVMNRSDVVLLTSVAETLPFSVIEALMCGRPVVATASGGLAEALEGPGITAPPGDVESLARGIVAVLRLAPPQRGRLAEAARDRALERFRLRTFLGAYRDAYRALARGTSGAEEALTPSEIRAERPPPREVAVETAARPEIEAGGEGVRVADHATLRPTVVPQERPEVPARAGEPADVAERPEPPIERTEGAEPVAAREEEEAPRGVEEGEAPGEAPELAQLRRWLMDPDPVVRVVAVGRVRDPRFADVLVAALGDDAVQVRLEVVRALARIGGPVAAPALARALSQDPSPEVREEAVAALASLLGRPEDEGFRP